MGGLGRDSMEGASVAFRDPALHPEVCSQEEAGQASVLCASWCPHPENKPDQDNAGSPFLTVLP